MTPDLRPEAIPDHLDRLYRAAWAMCGSREDAEDLVQETCAKVLSKRRTLAADSDALPYLLGALRNTFLSQMRVRSRRPATRPLDEVEPVLAAGGGTTPHAALEAREVFTAIAELSPEYRDTIVAVDVVGLSYAEAAQLLDVAEGTVMSRLFRGRARVAARVGGA